jgi:MFS family permease
MSVGPAIAALTGVPAGRFVDRIGAQRASVGGIAGMVAGCSALCMAPATLGIAGYVIPIGIVTASYALFQVANNTAVMADVPPDQRGVISGVLNLSRNLGLITGASGMGAVFALASHAGDPTMARPEEVALGMRVTYGVAASLVVAALGIALGSQTLSRTTHRVPL